MSDSKGRTEAIKKRLIQWIQAAMNNIGNVTPDWDKLYGYYLSGGLPAVSLKVEVADVDVAYGRRIFGNNKGRYANYYISMHVLASACNEAGESDYRYAHLHADDIIDYFYSKKGNATERTDYGITDVLELRQREASISARELRRVVIEGTIEGEKLDAV